jgi:predicted nucleotidyltransferase
MLLDEWQKFKGWSVLEFFLREQRKIHLKGLAKELKISPRTAQTYLQLYEKEGILLKEIVGNLTLYSLIGSPLTYELKKTYLLLKIKRYLDGFVADNPSITSLIMYGSSVRGDYDKNSDIDLLAISGIKSLNLKRINMAEAAIGREIKIEILTLGEIRRLAEKQDPFYLSVLKNDMLLYGAGL